MTSTEHLRTALVVDHGSNFGGTHNQVVQTFEALRDSGWNVVAAIPPDADSVEKRFKKAGVRFEIVSLPRLRLSKHPMELIAFVKAVRTSVTAARTLIRQLNPDLVELHGMSLPQWIIAATLEQKPMVIQIVDTRMPSVLRPLTTIILAIFADVVMTTGLGIVSKYAGLKLLRDRTVPFTPPRSTSTGSDGKDDLPSRKKLGIEDDAFVIGSVANFFPMKRQDRMLKALALLPQRNLHVVLIGYWSTTHPDFTERVKEAIHSCEAIGIRVTVIPGVANASAYIELFDIFVLYSAKNSEGLPTVILEAMATGTPVVASDVGSVSDVILNGETGFRVGPHADEAFTSAVDLLYRSPSTRMRLGEASALLVNRDHSLASTVDAYQKAYDMTSLRRSMIRRFRLPRSTASISV